MQDWTMELLTEVHAVHYMQDSMNGIMRVGLLSKSPRRHQSQSLKWAEYVTENVGISHLSLLWLEKHEARQGGGLP